MQVFIQIRGSKLTDALDLSESIYTYTYGSEPWFEQSQDFYYGGTAARSGYVENSTYSIMKVEFEGMGEVSFYWKVDCEEEFDYLMFSVDSEEITRISGQTEWAEYSHKVNNHNGTHTLRFEYTKDEDVSEGEDCGWVDKMVWTKKVIVSNISLDEALDNTNLTFTTGGDADWFGQNMFSKYGDDSAQSGALDYDEESWLETTVTGTGKVSFYWKADTSSDNYLRFYVDGEYEGYTRGDRGWEYIDYNIISGDGEHTLQWVFSKEWDERGEDSVWVDRVTFESKEFDTDIPLGKALDNTKQAYLTGGAAGWYGQNLESHYGGSAARSGECGEEEESRLETTVPSNGTVSFYWKVDAACEEDYLEFYIDDDIKDRISCEEDWEIYNYTIYESGEHKLEWVFTRSDYGSSGEDCGWVDKLIFDPNHFSDDNSIPLNYAVDYIERGFYSDWNGDSEDWFSQEEVYYKGGDAAQSGAINGSGESQMYVRLYSTGTYSFYLKTDPGPLSLFRFTMNGATQFETTDKMDWTKYSFDIEEDDEITLKWRYIKDMDDDTEAEDCVWVDNFEFVRKDIKKNITLGNAVDNYDLIFTTGGDADWSGESYEYYYGGDAARSGKLNDTGESWMQTTVDGVGQIRFYWLVDCERDDDFFDFSVDGVLMDQITGYENWTEFRYTIPDSGEHELRWTFWKDSSNESDSSGHGWVDKVSYVEDIQPTISISEGVDNKDLTFTSGGNAKWYGENEVFYSGDDAAQSGLINPDMTSWFQTTVSGKGKLTFHWKVSSRHDENYLQLFLDDKMEFEISGNEGWNKHTLEITKDGEHTIKWVYEKNVESGDDHDCAWVDKIEFDSDSDDDDDDDTVSLGNNILFPFTLTFFILLSFFLF
ncbi:hypothetical protein M0813_06212 [Anaeramoeba flamelloides]|uniref:Uncharacterized protein n=1 Tax=Anaeramoeba flamelloides TaxID=1746091 RepID=A0ABQ8XEN4_9EUKA|nr:hypothetical protein M0813_06212 [Anaeramoeba flamelloides]